MQGLRRWKQAQVLKLYACDTSHASFASRRGKQSCHLMRTSQLIFENRSGMVRFSSRPRCKGSVFAISSVILGHLALVLRQVLRTSLSSTSQDCITSLLTTVNAATNCCQVWSSYCVRDGFQRRFHDHNQFSPSTALKRSTNSHYKAKQTCTITTTHSSDNPNTLHSPTSPGGLLVHS